MRPSDYTPRVAGETDIGGARGSFPDTRWTALLAATGDPAACARELERLCARYWKPLYFYARRKGLDVERAKDAVQGFLLRFVEQDGIARLDPARGRLRGYLKAGLSNWLVNEHEREGAAKRGGGAPALDVDEAERELAGTAPAPEDALDREWALAVLDRALVHLKAEYDDGRRKGDFELVRRFFRDPDPPSYAEAAAAAGTSVPQLKSALHRARARYRELVRAEVAATVENDDEVEPELAELMRALSS